MREGTDELGWRYNAVFKQKGWSSKAGAGGWWGWVRRREWVRLRCVKPRRTGEAAEDGGEEADDRHGIGSGSGSKGKRKPLAEVLGSKDEKALWNMVKELESVSLDREKMEIWDSWLNNMDQETRNRLQGIIEDPDSVSTDSIHHSQRAPQLNQKPRTDVLASDTETPIHVPLDIDRLGRVIGQARSSTPESTTSQP